MSNRSAVHKSKISTFIECGLLDESLKESSVLLWLISCLLSRFFLLMWSICCGICMGFSSSLAICSRFLWVFLDASIKALSNGGDLGRCPWSLFQFDMIFWSIFFKKKRKWQPYVKLFKVLYIVCIPKILFCFGWGLRKQLWVWLTKKTLFKTRCNFFPVIKRIG